MKSLAIHLVIFVSVLVATGFSNNLYASPSFVEQSADDAVVAPSSADPGRVTGSHAGEIFFDLNRNGQREFAERGASDVTVRIETMDGEMLEETQSDAEGYYIFQDLPQDEFMIRVIPPRDYQVTTNGNYFVMVGEANAQPTHPVGLCVCLFLPGVSR